MELGRRLKEAVKPLQKSAFVQEIQEKVQQLRSPTSDEKVERIDTNYLQDTIVPQRVALKHALKDPAVEEALLESIDPSYYNEDFDGSLFELRRLPENSQPELVNINRQVLEKQLAVVTKKVYDLILGKQSEYSAEIVHVVELQEKLTACLGQCVDARRALGFTQSDFTLQNMRVLRCTRRRNLLMDTLSKLSVIKTLQQTDIRLYELLEMSEYPAAIQLLLECRKALQDYQQFDCMKQLSLKFERTLEKTEHQLDLALSKICLEYNEEVYVKLSLAFTLMGKGPNILNQLLMHYTTTIHNLSLVLVAKYGNGEPGKKQYQELCGMVNEERYSECLRELARAFFKLMVSYRQVLEFHERSAKDDDSEKLSDDECDVSNGDAVLEKDPTITATPPIVKHPLADSDDDQSRSESSSVNSTPVKERIGEESLARQKLRNGLRRLWLDMQQKFKVLLSSFCWQTITEFDKFIAVLNITKVMIQVGEVFCEESGCSADLEVSAEDQCLRYFYSYHSQSLATLKTYLEHESWELMPVRDSFSLDNLHEFCFLQGTKEPSATLKSLPDREIVFCPDASDPFESDVPPVSSDLDNSIFEDEGEDDEEDEKRTHHRFPRHAMTNTSLTIFRLLGRYLNMIAALGGGQVVTAQGLTSVINLFEFYLHTIFVHFASENTENFPWCLSPSSRRILLRIRESLVDGIDAKTPLPDLTPLQDGGFNMFNMRKRVAACESLTFLSAQLQLLLPQVDSQMADKLDQFTADIECAQEMYHSVYLAVPSRFLNLPQLLDGMSSVNWDLRDIQTQHSPYVDSLLSQLVNLEETLWKSALPEGVIKNFWIVTLRLCSQAFIEGFSSAKKCSNAGRALMQLDLQQFLSKVERMRVKMKPIPDQALVESLVRAYYLIDKPLEDWLSQNMQYYSKKQLTGLLNSMSHVNRKSRQNLIQIIEDR